MQNLALTLCASLRLSFLAFKLEITIANSQDEME